MYENDEMDHRGVCVYVNNTSCSIEFFIKSNSDFISIGGGGGGEVLDKMENEIKSKLYVTRRTRRHLGVEVMILLCCSKG